MAGARFFNSVEELKEQAVGGRTPRYDPAPLFPRVRRSASRGRADGNVAAVSHGQYVPTLTAAATLRVKGRAG